MLLLWAFWASGRYAGQQLLPGGMVDGRLGEMWAGIGCEVQ